MSAKPTVDLLYQLNDRPPWGRTFLYGLQWLIVFLPMVTVISVLTADVLGLAPPARLALLQRLLLLTGGIIILQTLWGHQLPILDGPAAALVITLATLAPLGQAVINGGLISGGLLLLGCSLVGLTRHLTPLFTDRVVGVIMLLLGLTVLPYIIPMLLGVTQAHSHGRPLVLALGIALTLVICFMIKYLTGLLQSLALFWGVLVGVIVFGLLGLLDFSPVQQADWIIMPDPHYFKVPEFDPAAGLSFALAYLAVLVNAAGSMYSLEPIIRPDKLERRLKRGLTLTGLSGILAGVVGVVGTVPYSLSPGIITVTRVGSRFPLTACGLFLIALAFLGKAAAFLSAIPKAVVAAALLASMAAATGVSVQIITRRWDQPTNRDYLVVGLPVLLGAMASQLPPGFLNLLPASIRPILGNGLIVGVVMVLLMEHVIMADKKHPSSGSRSDESPPGSRTSNEILPPGEHGPAKGGNSH